MTQVSNTSQSSFQGGPSGAAQVAGVVGFPIHHSLSPRLHNAWIEALDLDALYAPFSTTSERFSLLLNGLRGGVVKGLNVTLPFKTLALSLADQADESAKRAGAANLILFHEEGLIEARNTDGIGLLYALQRQAPGWRPNSGPIVILGAGGAARGAVATLQHAGGHDIRVLNRTRSRAEALSMDLGCQSFDFSEANRAYDGVMTVINTTSAQLGGAGELPIPPAAANGAVAMDMVYQPLQTPFLTTCSALGYDCVDGLDMLIGQAIPSFEAFYGLPPPSSLDARQILLAALPHRATS